MTFLKTVLWHSRQTLCRVPLLWFVLIFCPAFCTPFQYSRGWLEVVLALLPVVWKDHCHSSEGDVLPFVTQHSRIPYLRPTGRMVDWHIHLFIYSVVTLCFHEYLLINVTQCTNISNLVFCVRTTLKSLWDDVYGETGEGCNTRLQPSLNQVLKKQITDINKFVIVWK